MEKQYYAFISYKREDEKWAKWLQHKLEHYKFPTSLNGYTDLPNKIRPIFRDVTDLKPGFLAEEIQDALIKSQWLVIVCSPRSAKSQWVCKEAQTFIDFGRADYIIPFVIDGSPFSKDEATECYPEALLNLTEGKELLAANINEMGREAAVVKVIAKMFGIRFDSLWQRYEREQRRKKWMWISFSTLIALLGVLIGGYFNRQNGIIERQHKRLQQDSITMSNHLQRISVQKDSIIFQNNLILNQQDSIENSILKLQLSNRLLAEERDNVLKSNWEIKKKHALIISKTGLDQINDNNSYLARQMAVEILPIDVEKPNYPLTIEGEHLLRNAMLYDNAILKGHNDKVLALTLSPDGKRIISASSDKTIRVWDIYTGKLISSFSFDYKGDMVEIYNSYDLNKVLSHDKKLLTSYWGTDSIRIYDIENGRQYGKTLRGHTDIINSVVFSYNGKYIISSSNDKTVRIWDIKSGEQIGPPFEHESRVTFSTFNSDNKYIVSALADNTIQIWDIKRGIVVEKIETNTSRDIVNIEISPNGKMICCVVEYLQELQNFHIRSIDTDLGKSNNSGYFFSSDSRRIVVKNQGNFSIYNLKTGIKEKKSFEGHTDFVNSALFSPDGNFVVSASDDKTIRIWDANTGEEIGKPFIGHSDDILCATFTCDGKKIVSASADKTIRIWDVDDSRDDLVTFENDNFNIKGACYSPTGNQILTWGNDKIIRFFNVHTQRWDKLQLKGHTGSIEYASYNYNGTMIVSASIDKTIRIWDAETGYELLNPLEGHSNTVVTASFSRDGKRVISASADSTIRIWDVKTGEQIGKPMYHENYVKCAFFSPDGKSVVSTSYDKTTRIWDVKSGKQIGEPLTGHTDDVNFVVFSPKGDKIFSASDDKTIRIWDAKSGKQIGEPLTGHTDGVKTIAFNRDGDKIVSASSDKTIRIWDAKSGKQIGALLTGHTLWTNSVAFSPDGEHIVATEKYGDGEIIWNTKNGESIVLPFILKGHTGDVNSVAFSPGGEKLVSASDDETIRIWDTTSGKQIGIPLTGHRNWVNSVAFNRDGDKIISASNDKTIRIWDAKSGKQIGEPLTGHTDRVKSVIFCPNGDKIISASNDKTIRIWNTKSGKQIGEPLTGHTDGVNSVTFCPNGDKIISASSDKTIRIWDAKSGKQIGESINGDDFAISSDGQLMIVVTDNRNIKINLLSSFFKYAQKEEYKIEECKAYIIDIETGLKIGDIPMKGISKINDIAFSPNGKQIIFSYENQIRLWKYPNLQELINRAVENKSMKK